MENLIRTDKKKIDKIYLHKSEKNELIFNRIKKIIDYFLYNFLLITVINFH
jgi:hypothetical protein